MQPDQGVNLIRNASFEIWPDGDPLPTGWEGLGAEGSARIIDDAYLGNSALKLQAGSGNRQLASVPINGVQGGHTYILSFSH